MINNDKFLFEALTYDDVLLLPGYSEVLPRDTDTSALITRNIRLNIPLVSAAMDTVTEAKLAIAMALEGGIGIIHKNMSIEDQAVQVRKVKRSQSGMILDPVTLNVDAKIRDAEAIMREYKIGGIPVVDKDKKLIGIVTNRDLRFEKGLSRPVKEIMTKENLITATAEVGLIEAEAILQEHKIEKLPIVDKDYKLTGLITYKDILKNKDRPNACKDEYGRLRVGAAVGVTADIEDRISALVNAGGSEERVLSIFQSAYMQFLRGEDAALQVLGPTIGREPPIPSMQEYGQRMQARTGLPNFIVEPLSKKEFSAA